MGGSIDHLRMSTNPKIIGVIPARYNSTRFPGKVLAPLCGRPLIEWVIERVSCVQCLVEVIVATDDQRVCRVVEAAGAKAVMTKPDHLSGTDRVAEAAAETGADIILNVQGDEPLIDPGLIHQLGHVLAGDPLLDMATAATPIHHPDNYFSPNVVKVVMRRDGQALYFSRAPIPHDRDGENPMHDDRDPLYWRHLGIYGYQSQFLRRLVREPPSRYEQAEKLEQLRALELGCRMTVVRTEDFGIGVDTPEDLERVEALINAQT